MSEERTVCVVDDDIDLRESIELLLRAWGIEFSHSSRRGHFACQKWTV